MAGPIKNHDLCLLYSTFCINSSKLVFSGYFDTENLTSDKWSSPFSKMSMPPRRLLENILRY